eukprot:CAMPEP_0198153194 /NCGR_PEP_ID=MMETSP1443-20131203/63123_1 /TAXON_ID=186043 /ORGANISM="Entomoneis sp., Strain CCMP2396" /LENGTH=365 /DNA_ID=CAMNT_0043819437 /DNA_START=94 /DNA_END=1191 /DNA_ORIENTATION=+
MSSTSRFASCLVACNIYVSASQKTILLDLLKQAQRSAEPVVVVHAFCDLVYNRSSFHLAGTAQGIAHVASQLASTAIQQLRATAAANTNTTTHAEISCDSASSNTTINAHPHVGSVDHIAVMPLQQGHDYDDDDGSKKPITSASTMTMTTTDADFTPKTASGWAALQIGQSLREKVAQDEKKNLLQVYYYGTATADNTPLATVRRDRTKFFQSVGSLTTTDLIPSQPSSEITTVGAPLEFAENYNLRCICSNKSQVQSLTRYLRERDGGLPGVEALTLPYGDVNKYEVACNLLKPTIASADDIWIRAQAWQQQQQSSNVIIERGYRVGTTAEECLQVWKSVQLNQEARVLHDSEVKERLEGYIQS